MTKMPGIRTSSRLSATGATRRHGRPNSTAFRLAKKLQLLGGAACVLLPLLSSTTGCVRKDWYDSSLTYLEKARADRARLAAQVKALQAEVARLGQEIAA